MTAELQRLVDGLGARLNRSIAVDDRNLRLLAYNAYDGEVDELRVRSIMHREVPRDLVDDLHAHGGFDEARLLVRPVRPEFGLTVERMVMPVSCDGTLLGFLWLLASDGPLSDDETAAVRDAARAAAQILQRDRLVDELDQARVREHLRDLLSGDVGLHAQAARHLIEHELMVAAAVSAVVVTLRHQAGRPLADADRHALTIGLAQACRRALPRTAIHLERADHALAVIAHGGVTPDREIDDLVEAVQQHVVTAGDCLIGIGTRRPSLSDVHASYLEARKAVDVARAVPRLGTAVRYSDLGVYGMLAELGLDQVRRSLHPGLQRLAEYDAGNATMTGTLQVFLDNAGDMKRTAAELNLHRASLHYRLRRIEEIAQVDLSSGDDRLALHLGLKIAELARTNTG